MAGYLTARWMTARLTTERFGTARHLQVEDCKTGWGDDRKVWSVT